MKQFDDYSKSKRWDKGILSSWLVLSFWLILGLLQPNAANGQDSNFCSGNCTSGDIRITKVELLDINRNPLPEICDQGVPVKVRLKIYFNVTSQTRYGFLVTGDVYNNGEKTGQLADCSRLAYQQGQREFVTTEAFDWKCGDKLELRNVFTAWENSAPSNKTPSICDRLVNGQLTDCSAIRPKCYYYGAESKDAISVVTPVQAGFSVAYGGCSDSNGNPVVYKPITFSGVGAGGISPYSYQWVVRDSVAHTVLAVSSNNSQNTNYVYTPTGSNNLSVKFIVTDSSNPQKKTTSTKLVTVQSCCTSPTVGTSPTGQVKCVGETARFTVVPSGGFPAPTIQWQVLPKGGSSWGNLGGETNPTLELAQVTATMDGNKYRAVLSSGACAAATSNEALLTVYEIPGAPSVGAQAFCGTSNPTVASLPQGSGAYKWYTAQQGGTSLGGNVSLTTGTLWVSTVVNGCESPRSSVNITVHQAPTAATVGGRQNVCGTLTSASLGGNTPDVGTGAWSKKSGPGTVTFSDASAGNATAAVSAVGTYVFTWTVANGTCSSSSADVTVDYYATPDAPTAEATQPTCSVSAGTITVTSGTGGLKFSINSTNPEDFTNTNGVFSELSPGSHTIRSMDANGCISNGVTKTISSAQGAPAMPTVGVKTAASCSSSSIVLSVTGPAPLSDYEFRNRNGNWQSVDEAGNVEFTIKAGDGYSITARRKSDTSCVSDAATCDAEQKEPEGLTSQSTSSLQSAEQPKADDQLTAYPIPFSDNVTLEFKAEREGNFVINLYDMKGALVKELKAGTAKAGETTRIEVDGRLMADGMYLARMVSVAGTKTVKLLKKNR